MKKRKRSRWISLAHLRSIEIDKVVHYRAMAGVSVVEPEAYVQPLAHTYRVLLSEKDKTAEVNIAAIIKSLEAWARVHRLTVTAEVILKAARKAVEHPRMFSARGLARWLRVPYAERQLIGLKTIGATDKSPEEIKQLWRDRYNEQRREEYARQRDARGGMTREQWLAAHSASRDQLWKAMGVSRPTYYRRLAAGEPVRQMFGSVSKKDLSAHSRQPVSRAPEPWAPLSSGLPTAEFLVRPQPTSMSVIPESTL